MLTLSCRFAHSFKIVRIPQPIIPFRAPPQPVTVLRSGSGDEIELSYIHCLNGRVPKCYKLWALAEDGFREVHRYARVRVLSVFREDAFHIHFFNSRRFQIPFLCRRAVNPALTKIGRA